MNSSRQINENNLAEVVGGVSLQGMGTANVGVCCEEWKCNICGGGAKYNNINIDGAPICSHYVYLSCRSCSYYDNSNRACRKKL